jgi:hypothetical protein
MAILNQSPGRLPMGASGHPDLSGLQTRVGHPSNPGILSFRTGSSGRDSISQHRSITLLKSRQVGMSGMRTRSEFQVGWREMTGRIVALVTLLAMAATEVKSAESKAKLTREYDLKAAFLFNFSQFVEWPREAFSETNAPFVIGVLGDDPFGKSLDEMVANELARGHHIVVRRYRDMRQTTDCHILYISPSETARLDSIFEFLRGKAILAVGETDRFTARGGTIRFLVEDSKLRLKINVDAAKAAKLIISSKLLRQAEVLESKSAK